ncbi:hypothetical protein OAT67_06890 [Bacteriovoracaceae bacterium]|nr:hypothetical protein [Bacteriovoracaceae bacterium]
MAVYIKTSSPEKTLKKVKDLIQKNEIVTWEFDEDGDFFHSPKQWKGKAWMRPKVEAGQIGFYIVPTSSSAISSTVYAIYHGRLIEMFLTHLDSEFDNAIATSYPVEGDNVGSNKE